MPVNITLTSDGGTFDPGSVVYDPDGKTAYFTFTPTRTGTVTITGSNDGGLDDAFPVEIEVAPLAFSDPPRGCAGRSRGRSPAQRAAMRGRAIAAARAFHVPAPPPKPKIPKNKRTPPTPGRL